MYNFTSKAKSPYCKQKSILEYLEMCNHRDFIKFYKILFFENTQKLVSQILMSSPQTMTSSCLNEKPLIFYGVTDETFLSYMKFLFQLHYTG